MEGDASANLRGECSEHETKNQPSGTSLLQRAYEHLFQPTGIWLCFAGFVSCDSVTEVAVPRKNVGY